MKNETGKIRERIKQIWREGREPECVCMCYELWDSLGQPTKFANIECYPDNKILGRFEVR